MKHPWQFWVYSIFAVMLALAGCQLPGAFRTPTLLYASETPPPRLTIAPTVADRQNEEGFRVEMSVTGTDGRAGISTYIALTTPVRIIFRPMKDVVTVTKNGSSSRYSTDWRPNAVAEMRYCTGIGRSCSLPNSWIPFVGEQIVKVEIDWLGERDWGVTAQFRDGQGTLIPVGYSQADTGRSFIVISSAIDESAPATTLPPSAQTVIAQSRQAYPVMGSVKINEGRMMGGKAGETLQIPVAFAASSPFGAVTEMRLKTEPLGRCLAPGEMQDAAWQPYTERIAFPYRLALNWTTFKLHVQYRDTNGNVSNVYCSDIGIEGGP